MFIYILESEEGYDGYYGYIFEAKGATLLAKTALEHLANNRLNVVSVVGSEGRIVFQVGHRGVDKNPTETFVNWLREQHSFTSLVGHFTQDYTLPEVLGEEFTSQDCYESHVAIGLSIKRKA